MYHLSDGTKCTISIFAGDTKLGKEADIPEGCADIQTNLGWRNGLTGTSQNSTRRSSKCFSLFHFGRNRPRQQHGLGDKQLEVLVDTKFNMN